MAKRRKLKRHPQLALLRSSRGLGGIGTTVTLGLGAVGLLGLAALLLLRKRPETDPVPAPAPAPVLPPASPSMSAEAMRQAVAEQAREIAAKSIQATQTQAQAASDSAYAIRPDSSTGRCPDYHELCGLKCFPMCANRNDGKTWRDADTCQCRAPTEEEIAAVSRRMSRK